MASKTCSLTFSGSYHADSSQIAEFLFLFRGTYAAAVRMSSDRVSVTQGNVDALVNKIEGFLDSLNVRQLNNLFYRDLGKEKLITRRVSEESPLEIIFDGVLIAIVAAVILSGGKFKLASFIEAELPPLGTGILKLRRALEHHTETRLGFGVRPRKIKLSSGEVKELFRQDPSKRSHGGFQRFLVALQDQTNRKTGALELSPRDVEKILRNGHDWHKGGFQGRIRKIFDRHFKFDDDFPGSH
jgi:hypothetical protein